MIIELRYALQLETSWCKTINRFNIKKGAITTMVYVISKDGQPLMPIRRNGKARRLLNKGRARVCP